ncbi:AraC family transcriptional regulator [Paenibacillus mucilaginosus]|uniref:YtdP n=1 Tax=Paenibacillus mucilaginosus (strain KNP414) TaxID=1036673 RepID=F8FFH0_PAEMK|nr:helix-turn-helix domain-containing protein [Paenibacillus mucilaginosus]AEI42198.1 YtdP [Paenibacillus mucilaginosus KNP414]MCG7214166.1 AraC family transcriptional regulator [Paenibacillus mucilaginosus]
MMETSELHDFLLDQNKLAVDWEEIKERLQPKVLTINGIPVFLFDLIFNIANQLIDDQLVISLQRPFATVPMHVHPYIELVYVYQGTCTVQINEQPIELAQGAMILIDKMTPHTVLETRPGDMVIDMKLRHDYLSSSFLNRLTGKSIISQFLINSMIDKRRTNQFLYFPLDGVKKTGQIMEQLMCEYFDRGVCSHDIINSYLVILFTELVRHADIQGAASPGRHQEDVSIVDFLRYIEERYRDCSLVEMAAQFKFHPNALSAILKRATGKSFKDLLQLQRLNKAALYLKNTGMPITDIAEEVGYSSMSFFHKKFKEVFGETPSEYRNRKGE